MPFEELLDELARRRFQALAMGDAVKLAARRDQGILNARERIELLVDEGTFFETGLLAKAMRAEVRARAPADGKIAGFAQVDGRDVAIVSNDFTSLGASSSVVNGKKIRHVKEIATKRGMPLIFLGESAGARIPDRMGAAGRAILGQDPNEYRRERETPWVSAQLGSCYGSSTWYAMMSDFVVMRKGATMAVAGPRVTSMAIGQEIDPEDLGGWKMHADRSGLVDAVADSDIDAIAVVKRFLSYMPSHRWTAPPVLAGGMVAAPDPDVLLNVVPEAANKVYDVRKVLRAIFDVDSLFEIKERFGRSVVTTLARLDGGVVGVVANNPMVKAGALDANACRKVTSFLVLCDSFNIPIVFLVDVPGFLVGVEGEASGVAGEIINWMNALPQITVPKVTVIMRKSYGQAYLNMGGGRNADHVACWPTADLGFMAPETGANVLRGGQQTTDDHRELVKSLQERDSTAWELAALYEAHDVIDPRDTRGWLIKALGANRSRISDGVGEHRLSNWPTTC